LETVSLAGSEQSSTHMEKRLRHRANNQIIIRGKPVPRFRFHDSKLGREQVDLLHGSSFSVLFWILYITLMTAAKMEQKGGKIMKITLTGWTGVALYEIILIGAVPWAFAQRGKFDLKCDSRTTLRLEMGIEEI